MQYITSSLISRNNESAFFIVLNITDIWAVLKKFMYVNKKKSNIYNYRSGDIAAYHGYLTLIKHNRILSFTSDAMDWAARNGHFGVVQWLIKNRKEGCTTDALDYASCNGHLDIVKYLHRNNKKCTVLAMNRAAAYGHLHVVQWLHHNRTEGCTDGAMNSAVKNGHFDVVTYLYENRLCICSVLWIQLRKMVVIFKSKGKSYRRGYILG
jgi:hypothetical protein